eukprot:TRINITY_DN2203_c0_g1_i1.p3 TRINITY_DN2203_c0_g1~~TRINITY_DN2203_c0_g1_i1.p3  ORF type:complete len:309 (-),score=38.34 TRINITY_DN2203_c0_g1_i1:193-1119(-)
MKVKVKAASSAASTLKKGFEFPKEKINWFPGHMKKAIDQIEEQIKRINLFLEVVDARTPLSSHNSSLDKRFPGRVKRLIVINKADLAPKDTTEKVLEYYKKQKINAISINSKDKSGAAGRKLLSTIRKLAAPEFKSIGSWLMIGGVPNVGKSTIINSLRKTSKPVMGKTKSAKVGPTPGVTRGLSGFKISLNPLMYLIDTPGIMPMNIEDNEVGFKLLLCGCIREGLIENIYLCDYLLHCLNEKNVLEYVKMYGLNEKKTSLHEVLKAIRNKYKRKELEEAGDLMLKHFREGDLGKIMLDNMPQIQFV